MSTGRSAGDRAGFSEIAGPDAEARTALRAYVICRVDDTVIRQG